MAHKVILELETIAAIVFLGFMCTGCWDYNELDREASVSLVGNDFSENKVPQVSMEIRERGDQSSESKGNGQSGKAEILSATGPTFFDAIQNTKRNVALRLDFSHDIGTVFSEDVLKSNDFRDTLDRIIRVGETRRRELFFATSQKAESILQAGDGLTNDVGQELQGLINEAKEQQSSPKMDLNDFLYDLSTPGIDPIMPRIEVLGGTKSGTDRLSLDGCAAIRDQQFAGWFSGDETRGILWMRNQSGHPTLTFDWNEGRVSVQTDTIHSKIAPYPLTNIHNGNVPQFAVTLNWTGDLVMYSGTKSLTLTDLNSIEQTLDDVISKIAASSAAKAQSLSSDVFGFGKSLYDTDPRAFQTLYGRRWDEVGFARAQIHFIVHSKLNSVGYSQRPPQEE